MKVCWVENVDCRILEKKYGFIWLNHRKVVILQADYYQPLEKKVINECVKPPSESFCGLAYIKKQSVRGGSPDENRVALKRKRKSFLVVII